MVPWLGNKPLLAWLVLGALTEGVALETSDAEVDADVGTVCEIHGVVLAAPCPLCVLVGE